MEDVSAYVLLQRAAINQKVSEANIPAAANAVYLYFTPFTSVTRNRPPAALLHVVAYKRAAHLQGSEATVYKRNRAAVERLQAGQRPRLKGRRPSTKGLLTLLSIPTRLRLANHHWNFCTDRLLLSRAEVGISGSVFLVRQVVPHR
jgi:hypothetical protein